MPCYPTATTIMRDILLEGSYEAQAIIAQIKALQ